MNLYSRITPDPIALTDVHRVAPVRAGIPAIVLFVPANRVKQEFPVTGGAIVLRLAVDDVMRHSVKEPGLKRVE